MTRRNIVFLCGLGAIGIVLLPWQWFRPSAPLARPDAVTVPEGTGQGPRGATPMSLVVPPLAAAAPRAADKPSPVFTFRRPALLAYRQQRLGTEFVRAFALDSTEEDAVQRIIDRTFQALEQRALANATVVRPAPDTLQFRVRPFDGAAVYDELMSAVQATLGPARYRSFLSAYGEDVDVIFYSFGAERREIEIKRQSPSAIVVTQLRTSQDSEIDGEPVICRSVVELQAMLGRLVELVPAGF